MRKLVATTIVALLLAGCAATQTITEFDGAVPRTICIAKHEAVREGILEALEEGFRQHGARTTVVGAIYEEKHSMWYPTIQPVEVQGCDAIAYYVANWTWDISTYMYFANVWVTDREDMNRIIAQATYQTGGGPDKWINANEKILELVDEMYESVGRQVGVISNTAAIKEENPKSAPPPPDGDDQIAALRKLKTMYEDGLITEAEYAAEKQEILDSL